jgi:hypothetical protein
MQPTFWGVLASHQNIKRCFPCTWQVRTAYKNAGVNRAEILALRLYTGPCFEFYNTALRARGSDVPFGDRYPIMRGMHTAGRFVTTIHAINSGVLKLSVLTPMSKIYRGAAGMKMPESLLEPDSFGFKVAVESAFMSTTTDRTVAISYGQDWDPARGLNQVYVAQQDAFNRGCVLSWLSQYPSEAEVWAPEWGWPGSENSVYITHKSTRIRIRTGCGNLQLLSSIPSIRG